MNLSYEKRTVEEKKKRYTFRWGEQIAEMIAALLYKLEQVSDNNAD